MASPDNTDSNSTREQRRGRDGDPMITLNDAITKRFPQRNEWASEALAALSDDIEPTSLVHEVAEGWMRRGAGATAELIDREIRILIESQYRIAKSILAGKREVLDRGARLLLQREKIEGSELRDLMDGKAPPAA